MSEILFSHHGLLHVFYVVSLSVLSSTIEFVFLVDARPLQYSGTYQHRRVVGLRCQAV
jgi:hypothetical protein